MKPFRLNLIAATALLACAAAGCRTAGVDNLVRQPILYPNRTNETAWELLSEHNQNSSLINSLQAKPSIVVTTKRGSPSVSGRLAMERPRGFKLELTAGAGLSDVANIGSNNDEFWFWVKDSSDKAIYYCNYDESGASPLAGSLQPEWIMEALGLKIFSEEEARGIKIKPGIEPETLILSQAQTTSRGDTIYKETVLSESTHRIREHKVLGSDRKTLLSRATISEYQAVPLPKSGTESAGEPEHVFLPKRLRLEWPREDLALDVYLTGVQANVAFDEARRAAIFVEPNFKGYDRKNMLELAGPAPGASSRGQEKTIVRETLPAPQPRVRLEEPTEVGTDGARSIPREPISLGANLPDASGTGPLDRLVGPSIPTASDPRLTAPRRRDAWRNVTER